MSKRRNYLRIAVSLIWCGLPFYLFLYYMYSNILLEPNNLGFIALNSETYVAIMLLWIANTVLFILLTKD